MNKLRLFAGVGGTRAKVNSKKTNQFLAKQKHLHRIRNVLINIRLQDDLPPHEMYVTTFAGLAFILVLGLAWVAHSFNVTCHPLVVLLLAITSTISTAIYVDGHSKAPRTHMDHLDRLLAAYEPISKNAYRELQEKVKARGAMDDDLVKEWLELESDTLQSATGWGLPSEIHFLKKKV